jgi:peptidoglycan/xylan/chitin deacetylase (PgdA/CDA1 family)
VTGSALVHHGWGRIAIKNTALRFSEALGINACLRLLNHRRLLVLCYHGVVRKGSRGDPFFYRTMVDTEEFDRQLELLKTYFRMVSVSDLIASLDGRSPLPERAALITFDDGYLNNLTCAAPILEKYQTPALIGLTTGYIGTRRMLWPQELCLRILGWERPTLPAPGGGPDHPLPATLPARWRLADQILRHCKCLPDAAREGFLDRLRGEPLPAMVDEEAWTFLSWNEARELARRGFDIASHTEEHRILTRIEASELRHELSASKAMIERELGVPCPSIVYPNGKPSDFSPSVVSAARETGYRLGFILTGGVNSRIEEPLAIDRVDIPGCQPICVFQSRISGLYSLLRKEH